MRRLLAAAAAGMMLVLGTGAQAGAAEPGWQVHNPPTTMDGWYTDQITAFNHDSAIALGTEYWIIGNHRTYKRVWQWGVSSGPP
ncbi:hypothetical protein [Kutzneria albida]|uniref:Putative secreted protein n=1 Tax=Kutzneria albida DSM 43870 TaxID=1449976 RepID=W5W5B1_9PSEU|nr:hypothetical protein [Kutzneria albida]AHH96418.1 putative secreted protein [Kutzneria albida DSM 43870]